MLLRNYEGDIDLMNRQQKQAVEREESTQGVDMKLHGKKLRQEQEKELKFFREELKKELKHLKHEADRMPKDVRKDMLRKMKEEKDIEQQEKVGWCSGQIQWNLGNSDTKGTEKKNCPEF